MKLFIFALLSALAVSAYGELSCADIEKQGENGIRKMFIIEEGATIPKTEMELDNRCNDGKKLYKHLLDYKRCIKSKLSQEVFTLTTQSIGKLLKKNCGDAEGKKIALKLLQCATPERVKKGQTCAVGSLDAIEKLSQSTESKAVLIPKMCCLAHVSADCARQKLGEIQCADPSIKPLEHFEEALNVLSKDAMELACEDYKTLAQCQAKIPDATTEMKKIVNNGAATFGNRSLIKPLLAVAEKVAA